MTILYESGRYHIETEKVDDMPPEWGGWIKPIGLIIAAITIFASIGYTTIYPTENTAGVIFITGVIVSLAVFSFGTTPPDFCTKCGIKVSIVYNPIPPQVKYLDFDELSYTVTDIGYQLSSSPDIDAENLSKIIDRYKIDIASYIERDEENNKKHKLEEEGRRKCCERYDEVMSKVMGK